MKLPLLIALFWTSNVYAGAPSIPPKTKNLVEAIKASKLVLIGKPSSFSAKYYYKGKEITVAEVRELIQSYDSDVDEEFPRFTAKYKVSIKTNKILKGQSNKPIVTFHWSDLADSMCPHIDKSVFNIEGIWYTGERVVAREHDHAIYWTSIETLETVKSALK